MPSKKSHTGGPGTYTAGGVRCTMDPPFKAGASKGSQRGMTGTFDHARTGGDNGLPTTVSSPIRGSKTPKPGFASSAPSKSMDGMKTYR